MTATGAVTVESTAGSVLDGIGATNNITAGANSILWAQGIIGRDDDALDVNINGGTLSVHSEGELNDTSVNIEGTVLPSNTLTLLNTPPGLVLFNSTILSGGTTEATTTTTTTTTALAQLNPSTANEMPALWLESQVVDEGTVEPEESPLLDSLEVDMGTFQEEESPLVESQEVSEDILEEEE